MPSRPDSPAGRHPTPVHGQTARRVAFGLFVAALLCLFGQRSSDPVPAGGRLVTAPPGALASALEIVRAADALAKTDSTQRRDRSPAFGSLLLSVARSPEGGAAFAVGEHGRIVRLDPSSAAWSVASFGAEGGDPLLTRVYCRDDRVAWAAGHDATILSTSDGGQTWSLQLSDPDAEAPIFDLWFEDLEHGIAVGAYGLVYETWDGGGEWEPREIAPEGPHLYALVESSTDSLYAVGEFGTVLRSGDGGATWTELEFPYEGTLFGALPLDGDSLLVFGLRGTAYRSEDAGRSWHAIETGISASLLAGLRRATGEVLLIGLSGTILVSRDQGRTFEARTRDDRLALTDLIELEGEIWISSESGLVTLDAGESLGSGSSGGAER